MRTFRGAIRRVAVAVIGLAATVTPLATIPALAATTSFAQRAPGTTQISAVSCVNATTCVAVGHLASSSTTGQGVVVTITNGIPGPARIVPSTYSLHGIACVSVTTCRPWASIPRPTSSW